MTHGQRPGASREALSPQLATLGDTAPEGSGWLYEAKFDGCRLLARIEAGVVRCITRNGSDWSARLPQLAAALATLPVESASIDGEIVVAGAGDFEVLQNAFERAAADVSPATRTLPSSARRSTCRT